MDAARIVKETGCDAVMIGRAAATNPWIFSQMQQYATTGRYDLPSDEDRHHLLSGYYQQINAAQLPDGLGKMKQFACWFTHGVGNGSELRRIVHAARTPSEVLESVERFFEQRAAAAEHQISSHTGSPSGAASAGEGSMVGSNAERLAVANVADCSALAHDANRLTVGNISDRSSVTHEADRMTVVNSADRMTVKEKEATPHGPAPADQLALEAEVGT
jgi:hypothetical protein